MSSSWRVCRYSAHSDGIAFLSMVCDVVYVMLWCEHIHMVEKFNKKIKKIKQMQSRLWVQYTEWTHTDQGRTCKIHTERSQAQQTRTLDLLDVRCQCQGHVLINISGNVFSNADSNIFRINVTFFKQKTKYMKLKWKLFSTRITYLAPDNNLQNIYLNNQANILLKKCNS